MPRHLIRDAHGRAFEILVPVYYPTKPQPTDRAGDSWCGKKTLLSLTLLRRFGSNEKPVLLMSLACGTHQEWARRVARSFYLASALWAQADRLKRKVKRALIADKLAFLEWNAKESQSLASNGDSHGMYCIVRALAGRTQNGVALPIYKKDGTQVRLGSRVWIPSYLPGLVSPWAPSARFGCRC